MFFMRPESLAVCFFALVSFASASTGPMVSLAVQPRYDSAQDVAVDVYIVNSETACRPLVIDTTLTPLGAQTRSNTVVEFEIMDLGSGKKVERSPGAVDLPLPRASDFLYLDCGRLYGGRVSLSGPGWRFPFKPGDYRIRAKIASNARAYLKENPRLARQLAEAFGVTTKQMTGMLPGAEQWSSPELTFTITHP
jgi:hypothetical protein